VSVLSIIKTRRSIRKFLDKAIPDDIFNDLLEGVQWAPSGGNQQPWVAVVIRQKSNIQKVKMFSPGLQGDPAAVLVLCHDRSSTATTAIMDIAMAAQNVMLIATENGLGSCVVRSFSQAAVQSVLGLPSHITPELIISLGYSAERVAPPKRKPIEEFTYWERYGGVPHEEQPKE